MTVTTTTQIFTLRTMMRPRIQHIIAFIAYFIFTESFLRRLSSLMLETQKICLFNMSMRVLLVLREGEVSNHTLIVKTTTSRWTTSTMNSFKESLLSSYGKDNGMQINDIGVMSDINEFFTRDFLIAAQTCDVPECHPGQSCKGQR